MAKRQILAVDFGTSNSFFCTCPREECLVSPIDFSPNQTGIETAILYRRGRPPLIGHLAVETWGEATDEERESYDLKVHFKPDIGGSRKAYGYGVDFLRTISDETRRRYIDLSPQKRDVYFGVPSEADDNFRNCLRSMIEEAGYGPAILVDEPIGALLYHLSRQDISPSESLKGILVVDFGGGTCDFAYMQHLDVRSSWGEMLLGGRLFDDLFHQILLSRNSGLKEKLDAEDTEYYVHWYECRRLKERFSASMSLDRDTPWSGRAGNYGTIRDLSWAEFREAASHYMPTPELVNYISEMEGTTLPGGPLDLVGWFRDTLIRGMEENSIRPADIGRVILSGGSSLWPFVPEVVCETLHIDHSRLLTSSQPYAVIAKGIAMLPALRHRNAIVQRGLEEELPRFLEREIREDIIALRLSDLTGRISEELGEIIFSDVVKPEIERFRKEGGKVLNCESRIRRGISILEERIGVIVDREMKGCRELMADEIRRETESWFRRKGVKYIPIGLFMNAKGTFDFDGRFAEKMGFERLASYNDLLPFLDRMTMVVTASIVSAICGGSGLALIMSGPIGLALGFIIGVAAYAAGRKRSDKFIKSIPLPSWLTSRMMSRKGMEKALQKAQNKLQETLKTIVREAWELHISEILMDVRRLVKREIDSLSAINQI